MEGVCVKSLQHDVELEKIRVLQLARKGRFMGSILERLKAQKEALQKKVSSVDCLWLFFFDWLKFNISVIKEYYKYYACCQVPIDKVISVTTSKTTNKKHRNIDGSACIPL